MPSFDLKKAEDELTKVKIALMARPSSAFFTTLAFSMKHRWDESIPTACTDGATVWWNPHFFMGLATQEERLYVMLHEVCHGAFLHMHREPDKVKFKQWNIACDHVINLMLNERGFTPPTSLIEVYADPQYKDMTAEQVYPMIGYVPDDFEGDIRKPEGDPDKAKTDLENILIRARLQSQLEGDKPGTVPGHIEIFLNGLLAPKLPWHQILRRYLLKFSKDDFSWRKLNRRFFPNFMLPSMSSTSLIDLANFVDTSDSVSDEDFKQCISEVNSMLRTMKPSRLRFGQFDTSIKSVDEVRSVGDLMKVKFTGRGGTEINPVIGWICDEKPQLTLIFTDGYFSMPSRTPPNGCHVVWVIFNNPTWTAPFGKVIHYEL